MTNRTRRCVCLFIGLLLTLLSTATQAAASYVGSAQCAACHEKVTGQWRGSHHDLAMQPARDGTVLGEFNGQAIEYLGQQFRFIRAVDEFAVEVTGGKTTRTFDISHTFGVYPLQQYLAAFPGGRLQVLPLAWDSRAAAEGGQRWFSPLAHMDPQDVPDWTGYQLNWNLTCAECHSTHLEKNYSFTTDSYDTTFTDVDVGCEACHGPASSHVARPDTGGYGLMQKPQRTNGGWRPHPDTGQPIRFGDAPASAEINTCGACHARRSQLFEDDRLGQSMLSSFLPSLLAADLYHVDGQIHEEVYVYGSFLQSRMFEAGVTCSDCHDPHSLQTRAPDNDLCLTCHGADYAAKGHHFHRVGTPGSQCVDCHMPATTYMGVDPRRDHSFRVPDPALTAETGAPNACNGCHVDRSPAWAESVLEQRPGTANSRFREYTRIIHASRTGQADAGARLAAFLEKPAPDIQRATVVDELSNHLTPALLPLLEQLAADHSALVRAALVRTCEQLPLPVRWQLLAPLLDDAQPVVRALAGDALARLPIDELDEKPAAKLDDAWRLTLASLMFNSDEPGARTRLADFLLARNAPAEAEQWYRAAIELEPDWIPAYLNLADLFRADDRDSEGRALLHGALQRQPDSADIHHSLGLLYVRSRETGRALEYLARSVELAPANARYTYVYAVALDSQGRKAEALSLVSDFLEKRSGEPALQQLYQGMQ